MIKLNGTEVKPTIFPDNTSQIWQLDETQLNMNPSHITFDFENEAEVQQGPRELIVIDSESKNMLDAPNLLQAVFKDGKFLKESTLAEIRARLK